MLKLHRLARQGFTLIELLVVIAIIAILVALLLPAVQQAREAARRSTCKNNLKQLGIALHNYHDVHNYLPIGAHGLTGGSGGTSGMVWLRAILPFIELNNLFERWDDKYDYNTTGGIAASKGGNNSIIQTPIKMMMCPSDTPSKTWNSTPNYNYAINAGNTTSGGTATYAQVPTDSVKFSASPFVITGGTNGKIYQFSNILDGLSSTIFLGEVRQGIVTNDLRGLIWYGSHTGFTTYYPPNTIAPDQMSSTWCTTIVRDTGLDANLPCSASDAANPDRFSSRSVHRGGVHILMGDGGVKFTSDNIDINVWRGASSMAGAENLGAF
jgi:prepilin-type N-terminal cleavage/methylation domain-containing protein